MPSELMSIDDVTRHDSQGFRMILILLIDYIYILLNEKHSTDSFDP